MSNEIVSGNNRVRFDKIVHTEGNETINGRKLFPSTITSNNTFDICNTTLTKGTLPANWTCKDVSIFDNNLGTDSYIDKHCIGRLRTEINTNGDVITRLVAFKYELDSTANVQLKLCYPLLSNPYVEIPETLILSKSTTDAYGLGFNYPALVIGGSWDNPHLELDANEIMAKSTRDTTGALYLNNDGGIVYVGPDGIQSGGRVTVHGNVGGCAFYYWARTLDKTVAPSANSNMDLLIGDVNGYDTKYLFARFGVRWQPNKTVVARIAAYKGGVHDTTSAELGVAYPAANPAYGFAPETPSSPSAITILTYSWIPKDTRIVHTTGAETVGGQKTFSETLVLTGNIKKDRDTSVLYVCGGNGNTATNGGLLILCGASDSTNPGKFYLRCQKSSSDSRTLIGYPGGSLTWNGQTVSTSSDERLKTPIEDVNDDILDQWSKVQWGQFKFKDAVAEKGYDDARYHIGLIAQSVDRIFKDSNLDILKYGILCHDEHEAIEAKYDSDGNVEVPAEDAVDLWMVRYTEALCLEAAYQRRKNTQLENRITTLEEENESLKKRLEILEQAILNK